MTQNSNGDQKYFGPRLLEMSRCATEFNIGQLSNFALMDLLIQQA